MSKVHEIIIYILSLPLILYQVAIHIAESILMTNAKIHNYFFMKRFGLLDEEMVDDLIEWKCEYIKAKKEIEGDE